MANKHEGEAVVTLSDGRTLTLRRDLRSMGAAETAAGVSMSVIVEAMSKEDGPKIDYTAAIFYGALRRHHPDISLDDAYDLIASDGEAIIKSLGDAAEGASPANSAPANPPKRKGSGTGRRSSKAGAKPG